MGKKYPIAEFFTSPQGEGLYAGTMMQFIRFAGCSVGKPIRTVEEKKKFALMENSMTPLPVYREKCTLYDGREFPCDTDFRTKVAMDVEEILHTIPPHVTRVCLTGGEPLDQPLTPLMEAFVETSLNVHIETSGTKEMSSAWSAFNDGGDNAENGTGWIWISVSPKKNCLPSMIQVANEIKLLVDEDFNEDKLPPQVLDHPLVWVQPINHELVVDDRNVQRCLELMKKHPTWRLSTQMHKIWGVR